MDNCMPLSLTLHVTPNCAIPVAGKCLSSGGIITSCGSVLVDLDDGMHNVRQKYQFCPGKF